MNKVLKSGVLLALFLCFSNAFASKYYWVNGSGDWVQASSHWATTSGGQVYYLQQPGVNDTVIFDGNSFTAINQIVTADSVSNIYCHTMIWDSTVQYFPTFTTGIWQAKFTIRGSLILNTKNFYWTYHAQLTFDATTPGNIIKWGHPYTTGDIYFDSPGGGEWTLMDSISTGNFFFNGGTLYTNGKRVFSGQTIQSMPTPNYKAIYFGTSELHLEYSGLDFTYPIHSYADSCKIFCNHFKDLNTGNVYQEIHMYEFNGSPTIIANGNVFKKIFLTDTSYMVPAYIVGNGNRYEYIHSKLDLLISGFSDTCSYCLVENNLTTDFSLRVDTLDLKNGGFSVNLAADSILTIDTIITNTSACASYVNFQSSVSGVQAHLYKPTGTLTCYNLIIKDIDAYGGANFMAINSIAASHVTGWSFTTPPPRNLYWVGGQGNWNDPNHWSLSSNGVPGACLPNQFDNVFFDGASFTANGQRVILNQSQINCHDLTVSSLGYTGIRFADTMFAAPRLNVFGSLDISAPMIWSPGRDMYFPSSAPGHTIRSSIPLKDLYFDSTGAWALTDSLSCSHIYLQKGEIYTKGHQLRCGELTIDNNDTTYKRLSFGTSTAYFTHLYIPYGTVVNADSCVINANEVHTVAGHYRRININPMPYTGSVMAGFGQFDTLQLNSLGQLTTPALTAAYVQMNGEIIMSSGGNSHVGKLDVRNTLYLTSDLHADTVLFNNPGQKVQFSNNATLFVADTVYTGFPCTSGYMYMLGQGLGTLYKASGNVNLQNLILDNMVGMGGALFTASNSYPLNTSSFISGINVVTPATRHLYWVGGQGYWEDAAHWSLASGGAGGECIPSSADSVTFDDNSGLANDTVLVGTRNAFCRDMNCNFISTSGVCLVNKFPQDWYNHYFNYFNISGNMVLDSALNWKYDGILNFMGNNTKTIDPAGNIFWNDVNFTADSGRYFLDGDLYVINGDVNHAGPYFNTKGFKYTCSNRQANMNADSMLFDTSRLDLYNILSSSAYWDADSAIFNVHGIAVDNKKIHVVHSIIDLQTNNCILDSLVSAGITGTNNNVKHAIMYTNCDITGNNYFSFAEIRGDINLHGSNHYDTLLLNNPGKTITLAADSTQYIDSLLLVNSANNYDITIQSSLAGTQAYLAKPKDTLCVDYIKLQDINASGGAVYYAGLNSVDNGNNTGWNFAPCTLPMSDVWPGDANSDLVVDMYDLLYVGLAYNEQGTARPGGSNSFAAQSSLDWNRVFLNQVNIKHADCDGNGIIDTLDLVAINQNYNLTHPLMPPQPVVNTGNASSPDLYFIPNQGTYNAGDSVFVQVSIGNSSNPVSGLYGIAYSLNYENAFILPGSVYMVYNNSWLTLANNRVHFEKDFYSGSKIDLGLSRRNLTNASGYGTVATFKCKLKPGVSGYLNFDFSGVRAISNNESPVALNMVSDSVLVVNSVGINEYDPANAIRVFPTLTASTVTLSKTNENSINQVRILDMNGNLMTEIGAVEKRDTILDLTWFRPGVYFVYCTTGNGVKVFKVIKI